jgi:hypothetical protein
VRFEPLNALRRDIFIAATLAVSFISGCGSGTGSSKPDQAQKGNQSPRSLLVPSETEFDLGRVPKSETRKIEFWLTNPGEKEISLETVRTSCDCFSVNLEKKNIAPGEKVKAIAVVDSSKDASFTGSLRLDATGIQAETGAKAFEIYVNVKIE